MDVNQFVANFAKQYVEKDIPKVTIDGDFRTLETWDSLTGMAILTMIDDEYGVTITEEEFRSCKTPRQLFELVKGKK